MQVAQQLTIYQVLASPCLKEALKWHSVSVFSFENIFFVEKVTMPFLMVSCRSFSPPTFFFSLLDVDCWLARLTARGSIFSPTLRSAT